MVPGRCREEWDGVVRCGSGQGVGAEGRMGVGSGPEYGGKRVGGAKKGHIRITTESDAVVVPDKCRNSTTS